MAIFTLNQNADMKKVILFLLVTVVLVACESENKHGGGIEGEMVKGDVAVGGVFRLNEIEDFRYLFPHNCQDHVSVQIGSQVYEGLVSLAPENLEVIPGLAKQWEINDDATKFTFHLREGVFFHDDECFPDKQGREVKASDVAYCFTRLCSKSPDNQNFWLFEDRVKGAAEYYASTVAEAPLAEGVAGLKVTDDYTIEISLTKPDAGFLKILAAPGCWIYPEEAYDFYGEKLRDRAVGTGPFKLKAVKKGEVVVLERNPKYWEIDEHGNQLPYLSNIKITFQSDKKVELEQFRMGNLHMIHQLPVEMIDDVLVDFEDVKQGGHQPFDMQSIPFMQIQYYGMDHHSEAFKDVRVRQAFNYAIDRETLVNRVLMGEGTPATYGIVPPSFQSYPIERIKGYTYDPERAANLLAEAGYPNGKGFPELTLQLNSGGKINEKAAAAIQEMLLENLGVRINLAVLPMVEHYERVDAGKAEFWKAGWIADYPDPENFLVILYGQHNQGVSGGDGYLNPGRFASETFDSLFDLAASEVDVAKRMELLAAADQVLIDEAAIMPLYYGESMRLVAKKVQNFPINPIELRDFRRVWLKPTDLLEQ